MTNGYGGSAGEGEGEATMDGLGIERTAFGYGGEEVEEQTLRVNTFEAGRQAVDGKGVAAEGADLEAEGVEVCLDGIQRSGFSHGEMDDIREEQTLRGTARRGELSQIAVVEDAQVRAVLVDEQQAVLDGGEDVLAAVLDKRPTPAPSRKGGEQVLGWGKVCLRR